jgi:hypothetical protein
LAPVAALALLASVGAAQAQAREPLDAAWVQALAHAGQVAEPILPRLRLLADEGLVLDPDDPAARAALDGALAQRGVPEGERGVVLDALVRATRVTLSSARIVGIGPLEMTRAEVSAIAGPREGRDRRQVVARLRARVPGAATLSDEEATALVPAIVKMNDLAGADAALQRVVGAIFGRGTVQ